MEFRDLKKQYDMLKAEIDKSIQKVITDTAFISGPQVKELEKELAAYVGKKYCVTCANGTDALSMALMYWNVKEGDAVFVPDFTFFATGEVVSFQGATPVFVDVDKDTFNMDPNKLEQAIKSVLQEGRLCPKVIIPVDLFGLPAPYSEIQKVADKYNLKVLEDGAQGFGGAIGGAKACSFGDAATTSFFPAKPLGCYGDGGAIFTDDDEMAVYLESIRVHGKGSYKYENVRIGWNSRLDTIQAAVLLPKFNAFQAHELEKVNDAALKYSCYLKDVVKIPFLPHNYFSSWAQYTIQLKDQKERDELQEFLKEKGIPSMVYYPIPMHGQKAFKFLKQYQECPVTEKLCDTVLSLPIHPYLEEESILLISDLIKTFLERGHDEQLSL